MKTYKIHFPNGNIKEGIKYLLRDTSYSVEPRPDLVFWSRNGWEYKFYQITECSEEDVWVEEIERDRYDNIIHSKPQNYFLFMPQ